MMSGRGSRAKAKLGRAHLLWLVLRASQIAERDVRRCLHTGPLLPKRSVLGAVRLLQRVSKRVFQDGQGVPRSDATTTPSRAPGQQPLPAPLPPGPPAGRGKAAELIVAAAVAQATVGQRGRRPVVAGAQRAARQAARRAPAEAPETAAAAVAAAGDTPSRHGQAAENGEQC